MPSKKKPKNKATKSKNKAAKSKNKAAKKTKEKDKDIDLELTETDEDSDTGLEDENILDESAEDGGLEKYEDDEDDEDLPGEEDEDDETKSDDSAAGVVPIAPSGRFSIKLIKKEYRVYDPYGRYVRGYTKEQLVDAPISDPKKAAESFMEKKNRQLAARISL